MKVYKYPAKDDDIRNVEGNAKSLKEMISKRWTTHRDERPRRLYGQ
jgi:hypothetical protein